MPIEYENSYIFTQKSFNKFLDNQQEIRTINNEPVKQIEDYYLQPDLRIRKEKYIDGYHYFLTRKTGDKFSGQREEINNPIDQNIYETLIKESKLFVKKVRHELVYQGKIVSVDFIEQPMKLVVLEIESQKEALPNDIDVQLFGSRLRLCPLSAWYYFKRKIGICGAPSSGKSSMAQILSYRLNTEFGANTFHVTEFATTFIQKYNKTPNAYEQFMLWHGQRERELNASTANIVISDCPTFLNYVYLTHLSTTTFNNDIALLFSKLYKRVLFDVGTYTDIILLKLLDYKENNVRYQSKSEAYLIEERILRFLQDHSIPHKQYNYEYSNEILHELLYLN